MALFVLWAIAASIVDYLLESRFPYEEPKSKTGTFVFAAAASSHAVVMCNEITSFSTCAIFPGVFLLHKCGSPSRHASAEGGNTSFALLDPLSLHDMGCCRTHTGAECLQRLATSRPSA